MSTKKQIKSTKKEDPTKQRRAILFGILSLVCQIGALVYAATIIRLPIGGCSMVGGCGDEPIVKTYLQAFISVVLMAAPILQWVFIVVAYKNDKNSRFVRGIVALYIAEIALAILAFLGTLIFAK